MRRLLKFLHTVGTAGLMGGAAALVIVLMLSPASPGAGGHAPAFDAMAKIAAWIIGPSMVLTIATGLLAMVANPAFLDVGWVWIKAATGILVLQGGLHVIGPIQEAAKRGAAESAQANGSLDAVRMLEAEINTLWVLLAVSVVNVALGIWRPRLPRYPV